MTNDDEPQPPGGVTKIPVRFKSQAPPERTVVRPFEIGRPEPCLHSPLMGATYIVDTKLAEVECGKCGAKLNPMFVLQQIAAEDQRMATARDRYQEEQKRLAERTRTKCDHCHKMTRISRR